MNIKRGAVSRRFALRDLSAGLTICAVVMSCMAPAGCRSRRVSSEEQVRETIAALVRALEDKDLKAV